MSTIRETPDWKIEAKVMDTLGSPQRWFFVYKRLGLFQSAWTSSYLTRSVEDANRWVDEAERLAGRDPRFEGETNTPAAFVAVVIFVLAFCGLVAAF